MEPSNPSHKGVRISSYTMAFKLKMEEHAKSMNNTKAAKLFGVDRKRVIEWRKSEKSLQQMDNKGSRKRRSGAGRKLVYPDNDSELSDIMEERRYKNNWKTVKKKMFEIASVKWQSFKASYGWLRLFMKRHNIPFMKATHIAQKSEELFGDKTHNFLTYVTRLRKVGHYSMAEICNIDETPIRLDMPETYTHQERVSKTVSMQTTGHEKSRVTVTLAALADGTKLPPMVLFKGVRPLKDVPAGIFVKMTPQAWANKEVIKE